MAKKRRATDSTPCLLFGATLLENVPAEQDLRARKRNGTMVVEFVVRQRSPVLSFSSKIRLLERNFSTSGVIQYVGSSRKTVIYVDRLCSNNE